MQKNEAKNGKIRKIHLQKLDLALLHHARRCIAVDYCMAVRGCFVIGGEVLITPILLIIAYLIKKIVLEIQELFHNRRGD